MVYFLKQTFKGVPIDSLPPHSLLVVNFDSIVEVVDLPEKILPTGVGKHLIALLLLPQNLLPQNGNFSLMLIMVPQYLLLQLRQVVFYLLLAHLRYLLIIQ